MEKRCSFELFKSNVCHWLKEEGDIDFLIQVLESDLIRKYYEEHKKHTSNWQHGKPQKAYYDLEGLKIFYEDGKIWHYRPIDENTIEWC